MYIFKYSTLSLVWNVLVSDFSADASVNDFTLALAKHHCHLWTFPFVGKQQPLWFTSLFWCGV